MITAHREGRVGADAGGQTVTSRRRWWFDPTIVAPIATAVVYLVVLALRLPSALSTFYSYSDFPEALRLGDAVFHGGWGHGLAVPSQSGVGPLWVVGLLDQIAGSEIPGMLFGAFIVALAIGFMVLTARRVLGTTSAVAVGALCVGAPAVVAWEMLTPVGHESTLLLTAVLAWQLVALSQIRPRHATKTSLAVGALAGICITSDSLVVVAAVVPWIICGLILLRHHPERRVRLIITAGVAAASAVAIELLSSAVGIVGRGGVAFSPSLDGITAGLRTTALTLGQMISGAWYRDALPASLITAAVVAFVAVLYLAGRNVTLGDGRADPRRKIYVWFWLLSAAGLVAGLCFSGLGIQHSPVNYQGHYVDALWFALAAVLPIAVLRRGLLPRIAPVGISCLILVNAVGIARMSASLFDGPDYPDAARLTATLNHLGISHGYGGYWESYAIGWDTNQRITALPLQQCTHGSGAPTLCRYEFAAPAWYSVQPGPVFVIAVRGACHDDLCIDSESLRSLPPPEEIRAVGLLQVYVYAHDTFADLPMATHP